MTDFPHYVKIEMGTRNGWWTTSEHARLVDPKRYAERVFEQTSWCLGVRITSHDDGTVWTSGGEVPDTKLEGLGSMPPVPERDLGVGHPSDPASRDLRQEWDDILGVVEPPAPATPSEVADEFWEDLDKTIDAALAEPDDDVLGEVEAKPVASSTTSWDDVL